MPRGLQKNRYEITFRDGSKKVVVSNKYSNVQRVIKRFLLDADYIQRIYRDGTRGSKQIV